MTTESDQYPARWTSMRQLSSFELLHMRELRSGNGNGQVNCSFGTSTWHFFPPLIAQLLKEKIIKSFEKLWNPTQNALDKFREHIQQPSQTCRRFEQWAPFWVAQGVLRPIMLAVAQDAMIVRRNRNYKRIIVTSGRMMFLYRRFVR